MATEGQGHTQGFVVLSCCPPNEIAKWRSNCFDLSLLGKELLKRERKSVRARKGGTGKEGEDKEEERQG